jgi:hypothetical protein
MNRNHRPIYGSTQHTLRPDEHISSFSMAKRGAKRGYVAVALRAAFAANLSHALALRFPDSKNRAQSLQDVAGIPKSNTNRWLSGEPPRFDELQELADALRIRPYQLLMSGLDMGEREPPSKLRSHGRGPAPLLRPSING